MRISQDGCSGGANGTAHKRAGQHLVSIIRHGRAGSRTHGASRDGSTRLFIRGTAGHRQAEGKHQWKPFHGTSPTASKRTRKG
jgi:hypothetical protein